FETFQHRPITVALVAQRGDFIRKVSDARPSCSALGNIAFIEALEIILEPFVGGLDEFREGGAAEIAILVFDRLDARPINRQQFAPEQIETPAQDHKLPENLFERGMVLRAKVRNRLKSGFSVRNSQMTSMLR